MLALFELLLFAAVALVIGLACRKAGSSRSSQSTPRARTMHCPSCGSPANVRGKRWECPYCGDSGSR